MKELTPIRMVPFKMGDRVRNYRGDALRCMLFEAEISTPEKVVTWWQFIDSLGKAWEVLPGDEGKPPGEQRTRLNMAVLPPVRWIVVAIWAGLVHEQADLEIEDVAKEVQVNLEQFMGLLLEAEREQGMQPEEGQAPGNAPVAVSR